jgi:hypothetical protein
VTRLSWRDQGRAGLTGVRWQGQARQGRCPIPLWPGQQDGGGSGTTRRQLRRRHVPRSLRPQSYRSQSQHQQRTRARGDCTHRATRPKQRRARIVKRVKQPLTVLIEGHLNSLTWSDNTSCLARSSTWPESEYG